MPRIDLNSDAGENYGAWTMGDDAAIFAIVSSVNIACGGHAGDTNTMHEAIALAAKNGLGIGAHPSFEDKLCFGRRVLPMTPIEIERMLAYQIGGFASIAALQGQTLDHVKAHGALANLAAQDAQVAKAVARATLAVDKNLILLAIAGTELQTAGEQAGLQTIAEGFADRAYDDKGYLVSRAIKGAVIHDAQTAAQRALEMAQGKGLPRIDGGYVACEVQSICVHGDTPGAVAIASACRAKLEAGGFDVISFSK